MRCKESVADKYYGEIKVEKWPEVLDEFFIEILQKVHKDKDT